MSVDMLRLFLEGRLQPSVKEHELYIRARLAALSVESPGDQKKYEELYGIKYVPMVFKEEAPDGEDDGVEAPSEDVVEETIVSEVETVESPVVSEEVAEEAATEEKEEEPKTEEVKEEKDVKPKKTVKKSSPKK